MKYNFLFKPFFYIFSILLATLLVIKVEEIRPSDFGSNESNVSKQLYHLPNSYRGEALKNYLKNLCTSYKAGMIDSIGLDKKIDLFLGSITNSSIK